MKKTLMALAAFSLSLAAVAAERTASEMLAIARQHFSLAPSARSGRSIPAADLQLIEQTPMLAVYAQPGSGLVVVSADDWFQPVLGYSDAFVSADRLPDGFRWWVSAITAAMQEKRDANILMTSTPVKPSRDVEPLVTALWGQESPFNDLCPVVSSWSSRRAASGCVATAMAQIMYLHKHPAQGQGQGVYTIQGSQREYKSTINTVYDWTSMQDRYAATGSTTDATRKAVAQLVYDCGRASHMVYAEQGSGTTALLATAGLAYNFQYDSLALKCQFRLLTGDERWMRTIYSEIEAGRPVLLNAEDANYGAHAFVLDGVRKQDGYVHVNWGWTGDANGYFDLFNLRTHSAMTQAYGMNPYNFSNAASQVLISGIAPSVEGSHYESFFALSDEDRFYVEGDSLVMYLPDLYNYHYQTFTGLVGVAFEDSVTGHTPVQPFYYTPWGERPIRTLSGWREQTIPWYKRTTDALDDGTYFLYLLSWSTQEMTAGTNPQFIRFPHRNDGTENYNRWRLVKKDGHLSVTKMEPLSEHSAIRSTQAPAPRISGRYDLQGRRITATHPRGIVIERNGSSVRKYIGK